MDQESIVYGCIKNPSLLSSGEKLRHRITNRKAILGLATTRDRYSFLSQDMFSISKLQKNLSDYHTDVIHFGASYKDIEYEWCHWIKEFEDLLKKMYWLSVVVHLETELAGTHNFVWNSYSGHLPGESPLSVRCEWSREMSIAEYV